MSFWYRGDRRAGSGRSVKPWLKTSRKHWRKAWKTPGRRSAPREKKKNMGLSLTKAAR